jgi:predicted alternative tryptophan synthase beta-subunit
MSTFIAMAEAINATDGSLRESYVTNVKSTAYLAFTLMWVESQWVTRLEEDRDTAVMKSFGSGGSAAGAAFNFLYQEDSEQKDTQCGQWQSLVQSDQTQIDNDSDARKSNFGLVNGIANTLATINNLIVRNS